MEINELKLALKEKKLHIIQKKQDLQIGQDELKALNDLLNNRLDRLTFRKSSDSRLSSSLQSKENLQFIYETAAKRKKIIKNDIRALQNSEASSAGEKIGKLENLLKEKDKRIEDSKIELKNLKNVIRTLEKTIKEFENSNEHSIDVFQAMEKFQYLQTKLSKLHTNFEQKKKINENKKLYLQSLEKMYIKLNQPPNLEEIKSEVFNARSENQQKSPVERTNKSSYKSIKEYLMSNKLLENEFNEKSFIKLRKTIKGLTKTLISEEKTYNRELKEKESTIKDMILENLELEKKLKEKEKESNMMNERAGKYKELNTSRIVLKPLSQSFISLIKDQNDEFIKKHIRKITFGSANSLIRRSIKSCEVFSSDVIDFDDSIIGEYSKHHKINSILIFHQNTWILGFQLKYKVFGFEEFLGFKNMKNTSNPYETVEFSLKEKDFLTNIQGFYSNRIEALKFETKKGDIFTLNCEEKIIKRCNSFQISATRNCKCVSLIGGLDYFETKGVWGLVYIGMELMSAPELNSSSIIKEDSGGYPLNSEFITQIQELQGYNQQRGKSAVLEYKINNHYKTYKKK